MCANVVVVAALAAALRRRTSSATVVGLEAPSLDTAVTMWVKIHLSVRRHRCCYWRRILPDGDPDGDVGHLWHGPWLQSTALLTSRPF